MEYIGGMLLRSWPNEKSWWRYKTKIRAENRKAFVISKVKKYIRRNMEWTWELWSTIWESSNAVGLIPAGIVMNGAWEAVAKGEDRGLVIDQIWAVLIFRVLNAHGTELLSTKLPPIPAFLLDCLLKAFIQTRTSSKKLLPPFLCYYDLPKAIIDKDQPPPCLFTGLLF